MLNLVLFGNNYLNGAVAVRITFFSKALCDGFIGCGCLITLKTKKSHLTYKLCSVLGASEAGTEGKP